VRAIWAEKERERESILFKASVKDVSAPRMSQALVYWLYLRETLSRCVFWLNVPILIRFWANVELVPHPKGFGWTSFTS